MRTIWKIWVTCTVMQFEDIMEAHADACSSASVGDFIWQRFVHSPELPGHMKQYTHTKKTKKQRALCTAIQLKWNPVHTDLCLDCSDHNSSVMHIVMPQRPKSNLSQNRSKSWPKNECLMITFISVIYLKMLWLYEQMSPAWTHTCISMAVWLYLISKAPQGPLCG